MEGKIVLGETLRAAVEVLCNNALLKVGNIPAAEYSDGKAMLQRQAWKEDK